MSGLVYVLTAVVLVFIGVMGFVLIGDVLANY